MRRVIQEIERPIVDSEARNPGEVEYYCESCESYIKHFLYDAEVYQCGQEYGAYYPNGDHHETTDTDWRDINTEETIYKCPECEEAYTWEDLQRMETLRKEAQNKKEENTDTLNEDALKEKSKLEEPFKAFPF